MLPPLISLQTFLDALPGTITEGQESRAKSVVQWVSAFARREARQSWTNDAGDTLVAVPDDVIAVVTQVATRTWLIKTGVTQEAIGPTSVTYDRASVGGVYFTRGELEILRSYRTTEKVGLWTLTTTRGYDELPIFFTDQYGDEMLGMFDWDDWAPL